jgi:5-methylcytosine-specific restriction endonuclease McrA
MIRVNCSPLPVHITRFLQNRRDNNRDWTCYKPTQVRKDEELHQLLKDNFSERCGYCERSGADTIDHFCPRNPDIPIQDHPCNADRTWDWNNFILSCDTCQRKKGNTPPIHPAGHLMINPREDEPLRHLQINLQTGQLTPVNPAGQLEPRGEHTISVLQFDHRPDLDRDRQEKFDFILRMIVSIVDPNSPPETIELGWYVLRRELQPSKPFHMVAQQIFTLPEPEIAPLIDKLYEVIPEARELLAPFRRSL